MKHFLLGVILTSIVWTFISLLNTSEEVPRIHLNHRYDTQDVAILLEEAIQDYHESNPQGPVTPAPKEMVTDQVLTESLQIEDSQRPIIHVPNDPITGLSASNMGVLAGAIRAINEGRQIEIEGLSNSGLSMDSILDRLADSPNSRIHRADALEVALLAMVDFNEFHFFELLFNIREYCENEWETWNNGEIPPPGCIQPVVYFQVYDLLCRSN